MKQFRNKAISVIGLGYIGLPTAALLASKGYMVYGVDVDPSVVETVNRGDVHIVEPDLDEFVKSAVMQGSLAAFTEIQPAEIYIICVPTPFNAEDDIPAPNVGYVTSAVRGIAKHVKPGDLIILESTSPVGTTELIGSVLAEEGVNVSEAHIAHCPERVLPGKVMTELIENDRVVGGLNSDATAVASEFYRSFVLGEILETDARTAEMCKLTENSFRDVNIAFANELSVICGANGVNVWELIKLANHHPRVNILQPGTGVGGHCIAVDPWFIASADEKNSKLIQQARRINDSKPQWVVSKIMERVGQLSTSRPSIACLGLAFKPDIDDVRESPALAVAEALRELKLDVICVEPNLKEYPKMRLSPLDQAIAEADIVAVLVGHKEFRSEASIELLRMVDALDFCGVLS